MTINEFIIYLNKLNIFPSTYQLQQLERFYELLVEYNKVMNLTGIIEHDAVYLKHFYDSLTISKVVNLDLDIKLCDIGTGAGFPGIVLKIIYPKLEVVLVDCLNKRIKFLNKVIEELNLDRIKTVHSRIEDYGKDNREVFDIVTARAVAPLNILLEYSIPVLKVGGYFIPMKGNLDNEKSFDNALTVLNCEMIKSEKFLLPIENSHREILLIKKNSKTNKIFPRINSKIINKPL